jgi:hypothetical protein
LGCRMVCCMLVSPCAMAGPSHAWPVQRGAITAGPRLQQLGTACSIRGRSGTCWGGTSIESRCLCSLQRSGPVRRPTALGHLRASTRCSL